MGFLDKLADQINSQMSIGENQNHTLDAVIDGQNQKYGALGDFARRFDQSAERRYVEEGYLRKDPFNTDPKQFEILMQEPNATVLVKKRMFSSINENYRPDYMDSDEKLYYKAMKILFQNKCRQIAALEKLSKVERITSAVGSVPDQLMPIIFSLTDDLNSGGALSGVGSLFGSINSDGAVGNFTKVIDRLRRVYAFNNTNNTTTWITDPTNLFQSQFGQGTGTIEITNFTNLTTTTTLDMRSPGGFTFSISDPYEAMTITEYDIERAISDAINYVYNHRIFQFGQQGADQVIANATARLNQLRALRNASPITFKVNPDTLLGRRVVAIVDRQGIELPFSYSGGFGGIGGGVNVASEYLKGGAVLGFDGLDTEANGNIGPDNNIRALFPESEMSVFDRLVTAIFSKIQLEANSRGAFVTTNKLTNYTRRKLRFNFAGKLIIQPMDTVHIYMTSKSRFDSKLLSGLNNMFTGSGILQNLNKTFTDFKNAFDTVFNPGGSVNFQVEKSAYVGPDFPNFLWSLVRTQFVTEKEGTHVCAGIVQGASDDWSDGKFTVNVRGIDNTGYFEMGKVNFKPGVDVFNGALFDPLTPFKTKFDTVGSATKIDNPDLLDENKFLLGTSQDKDSPILRFKLGPNAGQAAREDNFLQDVVIAKGTRALSKVFYAPDGLVYKWKEGIGTLVQFGNSTDLNPANQVGAPAITKEPFAGQDIMNVLSLLITGTPYNFANYWKAVSNFDGFNRDPHSQQDSAYSYFDSLRNDLKKNNIIWGNFIPFKNLSMDEQSYAQAMQAQFRVLQKNKDIEKKLQQLADAKRRTLMYASAQSIQDVGGATIDAKKLEAEAYAGKLKTEIDGLIAELNQKDNQNGALVASGNDTSFDFNSFLEGDSSKQLSDPAVRRLLRRQLNYLTRRMSYNVRANEDKNLFIVDDHYDKDFDILAYEQSLTDGLKLFNNEFTSVKDKIDMTANLLNLEVFADTQGHIRVRSPQYNRMPSSILYRMMFLKKSTGVQVFPQFLDDLFGNQIKTLQERVEILEDQIRLDCAVLGIGTSDDNDIGDDLKCVSFITNYGSSSGKGEDFTFVSDAANGEITDLVTATKNSHPKDLNNDFTFTKLAGQAQSGRNTFTNTERYRVILSAVTTSKLDLAGYGIQDNSAFVSNARIDRIISRLKTKTGQQISRDNFLVSSAVVQNGVEIPAGKSIDVFKVTQEIAEKIAERQKVLKLLYHAVKNSVEARSLDNDDSSGNSLLTPGIYGNSHTPEIFEHMIEDESYDDYGPGSGSRYIIKRAQIRSLSISENPPEFTLVEVKGQMDPFLSNSSLPSELNTFPNGGNGLVTAAAVDYDMWRNYGFRQQSPINAPFLKDPNTQCAPYASMLLSRARRNILRGTVVISGNEFMQPGEVVFLQDRGMLFYVSSVKHNFTFGSQFTTTLELTYGHTPGEYIPTVLDVIGKLIYNNRDLANMVIQRQSTSYNDSCVGIILRDQKSPMVFNTGEKNEFVNSYSAANSQTINNLLYNTSYTINANNTKGNTVKASVELRIYYDSKSSVNSNLDTDLSAFREAVKQQLTSGAAGLKQVFNKSSSSANNPSLPEDSVTLVDIDLADPEEKRSPSQKAIGEARNIAKKNSMGGGSLPGSPSLQGLGNAIAGVGSALANTFNSSDGGKGNNTKGVTNGTDSTANRKQRDEVRTSLCKYVVDCWIKFEHVSPKIANGI
jgi:predicted transcriptional regulator